MRELGCSENRAAKKSWGLLSFSPCFCTYLAPGFGLATCCYSGAIAQGLPDRPQLRGEGDCSEACSLLQARELPLILFVILMQA